MAERDKPGKMSFGLYFLNGLRITQGYQLDHSTHSESQNISVMMFSLSMADFKVVFGWLVAHEILVTAQRPNSPSLFMDFTGGVWPLDWDWDLGLSKRFGQCITINVSIRGFGGSEGILFKNVSLHNMHN